MYYFYCIDIIIIIIIHGLLVTIRMYIVKQNVLVNDSNDTIVMIVTVYFPTDQLTIIQWHGKYMQQLYTINYDLYVLKLQ